MSDQTINEYQVKIRGGASIPESLKTDTDYRLGLDVSVVEAQKKSNQDGTFNVVFICKLLGGEVLKEDGTTMLMKDKSKWSQKWRFAVGDAGYEYDDFMPRMLARRDEIIDLIYNQ